MIYIILSLLLYTAVTLLGTAAARHADPTLAAAIVAAASAVIPAIAAASIVVRKTVRGESFGLWMAVLGGLAVGLFTLSLLKAFSQNKVGVVTPIVFGGAIFLSTILSYFVFKEKITAPEVVGLAFLAVGFCIIIYARAVAS